MLRVAYLCSFLLLFACPVIARAVDPQIEFFEKSVRPLLIKNCIGCHGEAKQKAGLRLDSRQAILKGGDSGPAIDLKKPRKSLIVDAIGYENDTKMPPNAKLSVDEITVLTQWIDAGAAWPKEEAVATKAASGTLEKFDLNKRARHWSLQAIRNPAIPSAPANESPVDRFLIAKQAEKGLSFAPPAEKAALLRRLSFDLTGLPPTLQELDGFLKDDSPEAYAHQVDRLLASPHFGEHWGRHWLDLVRYAETMGHEFDFEMFEPWRYRDYVIRAFNDDVPYDQFVKEHIAGDIVPKPRMNAKQKWNESILATAFWHFYEAKHSPVDIRQDMADRFDNQLDVFGKAFLASTLSCAKCHDHKFDAIATKDYYSMMAVLESSRYAKGFIDDPAELLPLLAKLQAQTLARSRTLRKELADELLKLKKPAKVDVPENAGPNRMSELFGEKIGSEAMRFQAEGPAYAVPPVVGQLARVERFWQVVGIDSVCNKHLAVGLPGVRRSRTFTIDDDFIHLHLAGKSTTVSIVVEHFQLIRDPIWGSLRFQVNGSGKPYWHSISLATLKGRKAYVEIDNEAPGSVFVDDIRFSNGPLNLKAEEVDLGPAVAAWKEDKLAVDPKGEEYLRALNAALPLLREPKLTEADAHREIVDAFANLKRSMVLVEGTPQTENVFIRGSYKKLGEEAPRRLFEVFHEPEFHLGSGRLELAEQLTDSKNPLVRRVIVNRIWKHLFGEGIVRSVDDFGVQGEKPSHPELLDYLAENFSANGWSVKKMIRQLVLTRAYRQSSRGSDKSLAEDPQNRLLSRFPIKRIEAESIRDTLLLLSGRLSTKSEGPGVPVYLSASMLGRGRPQKSGPLDGNGCRSVFLQVRRNFLNPLLLAFDYPTPFTTIGKRGVSNVPAQALIMLNNPMVHQLADDWGKSVLGEPSTEARIQKLYRMAFARPAREEELKLAKEFIADLKEEPEAAAWGQLAHALLNSKEFLFVP